LQHDATQPVGHIVSATVDKTGIRVAGKITEPTTDMPLGLASRLREAWSSIKTGLIRGVSIGVLPLDYTPNKSGGFDITAWDWLELSLVTIPAQPAAAVSSFKSITPPTVRAHGGFPLRSPIIRLRS
jgi:HK97 family phage prohead protease